MKGVTESWLAEKGLVLQPDGSYRRPSMLQKALQQSMPNTGLFEAIPATIGNKVDKEPIKRKEGRKGAEISSLDKFDFNSIEIIHEFDVLPCPAPRMTQRDKWYRDPNHPDKTKRQRPCVTKYIEFKNRVTELTALSGYVLTPVLNILFVIPMPLSWSKTKQFQMNHTPHMSRPDRDNCLKSWQDAFNADDGFVWDGRTIKIWGYKEKIIIFK